MGDCRDDTTPTLSKKNIMDDLKRYIIKDGERQKYTTVNSDKSDDTYLVNSMVAEGYKLKNVTPIIFDRLALDGATCFGATCFGYTYWFEDIREDMFTESEVEDMINELKSEVEDMINDLK